MSTTSKQLQAKSVSLVFVDIAIAGTGTTSATVDLVGKTLVGIITPASLSSTGLTFNVSDDNSTFRTLTDTANSAIAVVVDTTSTQYVLTPSTFAGVRFVQVEAGSSETAKTFILVTRPLS